MANAIFCFRVGNNKIVFFQIILHAPARFDVSYALDKRSFLKSHL